MAENDVDEMTEDDATEDDETGEGEDAEEQDEFAEPPPPPGPEPFVPELPTTPLAAGRLAFHAGEYVDAIEQFNSVIEDDEYGEDGRAKAMYWRAEARIQQNYGPDSAKLFEEAAERLAGHNLAAAAASRAEELRAYFHSIEHPYPEVDDEEA